MSENEDKQTVEFFHHPEYCANVNDWTILNDLYQGDRETLSSAEYLWLHHYENVKLQKDETEITLAKEDRATRVQRTRYENYLKMAVKRMVSLILKGGLNLESVKDFITDEERESIDNSGTSLESFLSEAVTDYVLFGSSNVMVNTFIGQEVRSITDEKENNVRPYLIKINPLDLKDWQTDKVNEYTAFRHEYYLTEPRANLNSEPVLAKYCESVRLVEIPNEETGVISTGIYYELYQSVDEDFHCVNYHPESSEKKSKKHHGWKLVQGVLSDDLDQLPLATTRIRKSLVADGKDIALKIYNKQSNKDNILYSNGYDKIFIAADIENTVTNEGNATDPSKAKLKISYNSLTLIEDKDSKIVKLEPTNLTDFREDIGIDILSFFKVVYLMQRALPTDSKETESEDNSKEQKEALFECLNDSRRQLLSMLTEMFKKWAKFKDKELKEEELSKIKINFNEELTRLDIEKLAMYVRMIENRVAPYPKWNKQINKALAGGMKSVLPDIEEIQEEIENTKQAEPLNVNPLASLVERQEKSKAPFEPRSKQRPEKDNIKVETKKKRKNK